MADYRLHDASSDLVNSIREVNQTVANTLVTILDRNLKFAQHTFLSGIVVLEGETNDMSHLAHVVNPEQQPRAAKSHKEMALKRHGNAIQQALTEAKNLGEKQAVQELIKRVRNHLEAQQIVAKDLLNKEQQ